MSEEDKQELKYLRDDFYIRSVDDRGQSPSMKNLKRMMELEDIEWEEWKAKYKEGLE